MNYTDVSSLSAKILSAVSTVVVGNQKQTELVLCCMLSGGHVLLEDMPGTGKTTLVKALAKAISGSFARVQCTPDLLPGDITGNRVFRPQTGDFEFVRGPVFTNLLLADEINRATPRTQSALLESMEEKQLSEGGVTYPLPKPFLVLATQNPVETQGTFPLPEAQLDRFLMKLSLGYPAPEDALTMMKRFDKQNPLDDLQPVANAEEIAEAQTLIRQCHVSDDVMRYMDSICRACGEETLVRLGPSPRALLALMRASQALSAIRGQNYVIPDTVKELAVPVLAHRIMLRGLYGQDVKTFVTQAVAGVAAPTEKRS